MSYEYQIYLPTFTEEQKQVSEHVFYIDDIIHTLIQMRHDGFRYAQLEVIEGFEVDEIPCHAFLSLTAEDDGGYCGVDYRGIPEVPVKELDEYAFREGPQPPHRHYIEFKKGETEDE